MKDKGINSITDLLDSGSTAQTNTKPDHANVLGYIQAPMEKIFIETQVRTSINEDELKELAASIARHGLLEPIELRPANAEGMYSIRFGHRRFLANQMNGSSTIDAIIRDRDYDGNPQSASEIVIQLAENLQSENMSTKDIAVKVSELKNSFGMTAKDISDHLNKHKTWVSKYLAYSALPAEVFERVSAICGDIEAIYSFAQIFKANLAAGVKLLESAERKGSLTRADAAAELKKIKEPKEPTPPKTPPAPPAENTNKNPSNENNGGEGDSNPVSIPSLEGAHPVVLLVELDGDSAYWIPSNFKDNLATITLHSGGEMECEIVDLKIIKVING